MRLEKSLLCAVSALALSAGAALANQDWMSEEMYGPEPMATEETEIVTIYPVEVTEYYILVPSESSEMPG